MPKLPSAEQLAIQQQENSVIASERLRPASGRHDLYDHYWPPVTSFAGLGGDLARFLALPGSRQAGALASLRHDPDRHGRILHEYLSVIYSYLFGYRDGPCSVTADDDLETSILTAKIGLERELVDYWLAPGCIPEFTNQLDAADYLDEFAENNPGVTHSLFNFLRDEATPGQMARFLQCEVIRNEVVDDEVALLVAGLQGSQKAVAAANLWDECGRGRLENFHTYWLRELLQATEGWENLTSSRTEFPWFTRITSNVFAALLTRPAYKQMAYGCFLISESWVEPHFRRILDGMERAGIAQPGIRIYFAAHVAIDPRHSRELSDGLRARRPALTPAEVQQVVRGAHLASAAGVCQFDRVLDYLRSLAE
jgi:hypothetical protein